MEWLVDTKACKDWMADKVCGSPRPILEHESGGGLDTGVFGKRGELKFVMYFKFDILSGKDKLPRAEPDKGNEQ